jgi:adenylate cyclase class 2
MGIHIETRARASSFADLRLVLLALGGKKKKEMRQRDIYFDLKNDKTLKLRIINGESAVLLAYHKVLGVVSAESEWRALDIRAPEQVLDFLVFTLGVHLEVQKARETWTIKNTQVHLDRVDGLGSFVEVDTMILKEDKQKAQLEHDDFLDLLRVEPKNFVECSYSQLLLEKQAEATHV